MLQVYDFTSEDLLDQGEIGRGGFGNVNRMIHKKSNTIMAVKVSYSQLFVVLIKTLYRRCHENTINFTNVLIPSQ